MLRTTKFISLPPPFHRTAEFRFRCLTNSISFRIHHGVNKQPLGHRTRVAHAVLAAAACALFTSCYITSESNDGLRTGIEREFVSKAKTVLVIFAGDDEKGSSSAEALAALEAAKGWVTKGSYLLCENTATDYLMIAGGATSGANGESAGGPMRAVDAFIAANADAYVIDRRFESLLISRHHRGWLRRKA